MNKTLLFEYHRVRWLTGIISWNEFENLIRALNSAKLIERLTQEKDNSR